MGWTAAQARDLYNVPYWGDGYFDVGANGHLLVRPKRNGTAIDLYELTRSLPRQGLDLPVLLRFNAILHDRVDALTGAFGDVIRELGYGGRYTAVYPIKVNQQKSVVEEIVRHGGDRVGLEAGSKPELAAVLGLALPGALVVCNGYKDRAYLRRALIGQKLGHRVYVVVEKMSELPLLLKEAKALDVEPLIGLRVRLGASQSTQQNTGGDKAKFGLTTAQLLEAIEMMRAAGKLGCVRMVHFHLGSQVANVGDIQRGMREAARYYVELRALGAPLDIVDVGGGLGIDYDGTRSRSFCSINYSLREYALNIVRTLQEVCREAGQPEPGIVSESGRALTAHHAVLVTSVVDSEGAPTQAPPPPDVDAPQVLRDMHTALGAVGTRPPLECLHDAGHFLAEAQAAYTHGVISVVQRAQVEQGYYAVCRAVSPLLDPSVRVHREALDELREKLAEKYFCNFSVFQSIPDVWGIDQVFPILPIHRLDERPALRATLCDLTCDSDGRIDQYVERGGVETTLPLHALRKGEPYLLAIFLVGAYQEILGDMHNLFGDTNAVNVVLDDQGGWRLEDPELGDRTDELLRYVHLEPKELAASYKRKLDAMKLPAAERKALLAELEAGLTGYTYLT
ncbi:MAG TPA: biosynthetic arginine decarboxylase [Verrucomicrobiae bacterium]|nr:biosynthetic arginine decarboxylase [Verrucomicrobiae bacterium]